MSKTLYNLTMIDVLKDQKLLGMFLGKDQQSWSAWFTFLRAFFALEREDGDLKLFKQCTGRKKWPRKPAKEAWLVIGVRAGKSYVIALLAAYLAVFKQYKLSIGEKGFIICVAPTIKQAKIVKSYLSGFFNDNPFLKDYLSRETATEIELTNNIVITCISSDYRSLRGYTAVACIVDEIAYLMIEGNSTRPDIEIVRALRSRLLNTDGPFIAISSPYAQVGMLYNIYKRHYGKSKSSVLVWQAPSLVMNPLLNAKAIKRAFNEDPAAASADYSARFRSDIESYISRKALEAVIIEGRFELPYISENKYFSFVDPSGGSVDSFCLGIAHDEDGVAVLDLVREVRPPFSPEQVCFDFAKTLKEYHLYQVSGDRYGGEWPREQFRKHGITYKLSDKPKSEIYKEFLPLVNSGRVELLDNSRLFRQLFTLERKTGRGGRDSIDHPIGQHDDLSNVCAGVCVNATKRKMWAGTVPLMGI